MSEAGKRVLVLLDEPVSAECLVGLLAGTLGLTSAEVTLLHVVTVPRTSPLEASALREPSREALEWLDALVSSLAEHGLTARAKVALSRDVETALVESVEGHDLLVIPTRSMGSGLLRALRGCPAEKLADSVRIPVVLVSRDLMTCPSP